MVEHGRSRGGAVRWCLRNKVNSLHDRVLLILDKAEQMPLERLELHDWKEELKQCMYDVTRTARQATTA